jgi:hypothetical protein
MYVSIYVHVALQHHLDTVIRTVYHKYFHPKEVFISNGILNRAVNQAAGKQDQTSHNKNAALANVAPSLNGPSNALANKADSLSST